MQPNEEDRMSTAEPGIGDDHPPVAQSDDPWARYTLQTVRGGILSSVFVILVVTLYLVLPGHNRVNQAGTFALILVATALTVIIGMLRWEQILARPHGRMAVYGWAIAMVGMVDLGIAFTHGAQSELFVLLVVTPVFLAGPLNPISVQITLGAFTTIGYIVTLAATGWGIEIAELVFRLGVIMAASLAVGLLNHELGRSFQRQMAEHKASENRVALWSRVAEVARQIDVSDVDHVLVAVVDALGTLGFEASDICAIDENATTYRVLHARNLDADYTSRHHSVTTGAVGLVLQKRSIVVIADYATKQGSVPMPASDGYQTVMAGPVWVNGELGAILEAATRERRTPLPEQIAAFEMLAGQAGHALENAQLLEQQRRDTDHFRQLLESSPDAVVVANVADGLIVEVSNQAETLFGYSAGELVGKPASMLMPERVRSGQMSIIDNWIQGIGEAFIGVERTIFALRKDGSEIAVEASFGTLDTPQGEVISVAVRDVTERREFERRLAHQATHDPLTGLANRELFMQRLDRSLHARLTVDPPMTVCLLDLDHFKYLNDSRGHRVGDALVVAVAKRLERMVDGHFIARLGGDEFGLLVEGLDGHVDAIGFGHRLLSVFDQPFIVEDIDCYITASIGIAFGFASDRAETIMSNADAAVNRAKQNGRSRFEFFDEALTRQAANRVATVAQLHMALDRSEFRLVYQPVISLDGDHLVGMEALLRWHHPTRGEVQPLGFISTAEDTGLIVPIGRWVLHEGCRQLAEWRQRYPDRPDSSMSINVSSRQLEHDHFVNDVADALMATQIPPDLLILEITESFFMRDFQAAVRRLHALKELGIRLAIDDFGTGFSSLFSLSKLPLDIVKIDKTFIDSLGSRYDAVVAAVVTLGDAFGLDVVAEGIETRMQRDRLVELGCRFAQGFYFSRPLEPMVAETIFAGGVGAARPPGGGVGATDSMSGTREPWPNAG
jgi:diguanylate cyclase (GGDEF)-like protein/PAS domain S-box-containing protein